MRVQKSKEKNRRPTPGKRSVVAAFEARPWSYLGITEVEVEASVGAQKAGVSHGEVAMVCVCARHGVYHVLRGGWGTGGRCGRPFAVVERGFEGVAVGSGLCVEMGGGGEEGARASCWLIGLEVGTMCFSWQYVIYMFRLLRHTCIHHSSCPCVPVGFRHRLPSDVRPNEGHGTNINPPSCGMHRHTT